MDFKLTHFRRFAFLTCARRLECLALMPDELVERIGTDFKASGQKGKQQSGQEQSSASRLPLVSRVEHSMAAAARITMFQE